MMRDNVRKLVVSCAAVTAAYCVEAMRVAIVAASVAVFGVGLTAAFSFVGSMLLIAGLARVGRWIGGES